MNTYLMEIRRYFKDYERFKIIACNKLDAIKKAKEYVFHNPLFSGGNYDFNDIKVVKKLKQS